MMWLSMPGNHCLGTSNGRFQVHNLRAQADAAYNTGTWKPPPPTTVNGCRLTSGRLGQQYRLVPEGPVSLQICRQGRSARTVSGSQTDLARLTSALDQLPTAAWGYWFVCGGTGEPAAMFILTFGYPLGPPVQVKIQQGCRPAIDNGSLQADDANSVLPLIQQRLGSN
jgi:hypothetical protein